MKIHFLFLTALVFLLAAGCQPTPMDATPEPMVSAAAAATATVLPRTRPAALPTEATAAATAAASRTPDAAPLASPAAATAIPNPQKASGASAAELKYRVLDQFPNHFFCDPDFYPVARSDEADLARQRFPDLTADTAEFQAILEHNGLGGLTEFTDEQKLFIYREHKRLAAVLFQPSGTDYQFQLQTGAEDNQGSLITGTIDANGTVSMVQRQPIIPTCPICLASYTPIDTPQGPVAVEALRPGDLVWTMEASGERAAAPILQMVRVLVPADHQMVHVVLGDGRQLWASPGHPTADGRRLADLHLGDLLDGERISWIGRLPYRLPATYDLLPSGSSGTYWAGGILVASTLK